MSKSNLYAASNQWATRPADERFWTLAEAREVCKSYADSAEETSVDFGTEAVMVSDNGNLALTLDGGKGNRVATMTNWGFGQLCRLGSAPADYLRRLPADLAAQCLEKGLDNHFAGRDDMTCKALVHSNGSTVLRSLTSEKYSRFWNWEVFDRLIGLQGQGWKVPPARPSSHSGSNVRAATEADCLDVRMKGLGITPGSMIAPAGIYASDHDMFAFMVNEQYRIDDGSDGGLSRGFFVQNSEVGASSLRVTCFHYRHVCGNHIVWDASNVIEVAVRHIGDVAGRFHMAEAVGKFLNASTAEETARVQRARTLELGATRDEVLDAVFKAVGAGRRAGLPSGMNFKQLGAAYDLAERFTDVDGSPRTVWGYVNGLTRLSQETGFMDDRTFLDRAGSTILALAV